MSANQRGYALVFALIVLAAIGTTYLASRDLMASSDTPPSRVLAGLKDAKAALIARQYLNWVDPAIGKPGMFSCPDVTAANEGESDGATCFQNKNWIMGHLQWKDLGLPYATDDSGECAWFAISTSFLSKTDNDERIADSTDSRFAFRRPVNPGNHGSIRLADVSGNTEDVIGLLIAPGGALSNQARKVETGRKCLSGEPAAFFENLSSFSNVSGTPAFIRYYGRSVLIQTTGACVTAGQTFGGENGGGSCFNDIVVPITADDVMRPLIRLALQRLSEGAIFPEIDAAPGSARNLAEIRNVTTLAFDARVFPVTNPANLVTNPNASHCTGIDTGVTDAAGSRILDYSKPVSWLSCNQWYDYVQIVADGTDKALQLSAGAYRCTLHRDHNITCV